MTTRWEVEKAVLYSQLEPPARLIVLALLAKVDNDTAVIPPEFTPSLSTIEAMTGLSRSAVAEWLAALEGGGWVKRSKPPRNSRTDRTRYALFVGSGAVQRPVRSASKTKPSGPHSGPPTPSSSPPSGPPAVRTADHQTPDSDQFGGPHSRPPTPSGSPPHGPPGVRTTDPGSPHNGPAPSKSSPTENSSSKARTRQRGTRLPDNFHATAEMIAWARENTPLVGAAETEAFIDYFRSAPGQKGVKLDWQATWRNWMRREQKRVAEQHAREERYAAARAGAKPQPQKAIPTAEQCPNHRGYPGGTRADGQPKCGQCRIENRGRS